MAERLADEDEEADLPHALMCHEDIALADMVGDSEAPILLACLVGLPRLVLALLRTDDIHVVLVLRDPRLERHNGGSIADAKQNNDSISGRKGSNHGKTYFQEPMKSLSSSTDFGEPVGERSSSRIKRVK